MSANKGQRSGSVQIGRESETRAAIVTVVVSANASTVRRSRRSLICQKWHEPCILIGVLALSLFARLIGSLAQRKVVVGWIVPAEGATWAVGFHTG